MNRNPNAFLIPIPKLPKEGTNELQKMDLIESL